MEQTHRDGLDPVLGRDPVDDRGEVAAVEGRQHVPVPVEPFPDLEAQVPLHQRRGLLPAEIVGERNPDAAKLQHVAEAFGGDEGGASPQALQDRVGGDGGRVHDLGHRPERRCFRSGSGPACEVGSDTLGDRPRVVVRRGRHLQPVKPAVATREDEVGECPADVDTHPDRTVHSPLSRRAASTFAVRRRPGGQSRLRHDPPHQSDASTVPLACAPVAKPRGHRLVDPPRRTRHAHAVHIRRRPARHLAVSHVGQHLPGIAC